MSLFPWDPGQLQDAEAQAETANANAWAGNHSRQAEQAKESFVFSSKL